MSSPQIIMNPGLTDAELEQHGERVKGAQALFKEALRRYKEERDNQPQTKRSRTDDEIVQMALKTLIHNGYTRAEVMDAMGQTVAVPPAVL